MNKLVCFLLFSVFTLLVHAQTMDRLIFGNTASEKSHRFDPGGSETMIGGLQQPARRLLPPPTTNWEGGRLSFTMRIDPDHLNYFTIRLWGSDTTHDWLYLVSDGKLIGYRHLGDVDMLDVGNDAPMNNGRFFYHTFPLPLSLTKGKTTIRLEIRSQGEIWGYGNTWERYQKNMLTPTRGIYAVYIHPDCAFEPPADELQGNIPPVATRLAPGPEILERLKQRENHELDALLDSDKPLTQMQLQFLAKAWRVAWSHGYNNPRLISRVTAGLDNIYRSYKKDTLLAHEEPSTWNPDWFGLGPSGQVIYLLQEPLHTGWDESIDDGVGGRITRREAFATMLVACRNWHQRHRRQYSNQSMINDLYGIYYANKGLEVLHSQKAAAEEDMLRYFYESLGLQPWLGSETDHGPDRSQGDHYMELTAKGLTKELGYVGNYGEVLDWVSEMYDATRPQPDAPGDARVKAAVEKIALARAPFRYPMFDAQGYTAMRQETVVGWRDMHYPGDIAYAQRPSWDGTPLQVAAVTENTKLIGYVQQMLTDNQFFATLRSDLEQRGLRTTIGLLSVPDQYEKIRTEPASSSKLPMSPDQPDFVFSDEEDGVVAVKNGEEIFYASLYWRARSAVNFLARVHSITPHFDRIATVAEEETFDSSGQWYSRPDWTNMGFGNGGLHYPDSLHSALAGEQLPIARIPAGVPFKPGDENPAAGRAQFYLLHYGRYLVAMNASMARTYECRIPPEFTGAINLVTRQTIVTKVLKVPPMTTVVLFSSKQ